MIQIIASEIMSTETAASNILMSAMNYRYCSKLSAKFNLQIRLQY